MINILEEHIYNKIAAGEVVERPASVVKELIENSLDAKAKNIVVEILKFGTEQIKVIDDGIGIEKQDLDKVFLKFATSKIKTETDLDNIHSFGFRGEALASIASVSNTVLITKTIKDETATKITLKENKIIKTEEVYGGTGTTIVVNNLFSNVPARLKFLKKPQTEENEILNVVSKFILANPKIAFELIIDGKTKFKYNGTSLKEAVFLIYGKETSDNLIFINYADEYLKINGFVGAPKIAKSSRNYQTTIVNGRFISNSTIQTAVDRAFENYLMHGKYPFFVLSIDLLPIEVDVNIHPRKSEVRFSNNQKIFSSVFHSVSGGIANFSVEQNKQLLSGFNTTKAVDLSDEINQSINQNYVVSEKQSTKTEMHSSEFSFFDSSFEAIKQMEVKPSEVKNPEIKEQEVKTNFDIKIIGSVFNTYIILEKGNELIFIDEHAAHERILFDKLTSKVDENKLDTQSLLVPFIFSVDFLEEEIVKANLNEFLKLGFSIEEFGNMTYKISSVPVYLSEINLKVFIEDAIKSKELKNVKNSDLIINKLKQKACKAAIKAGYKLENSEIESLLNQMLVNKTTLLCPHGRPIITVFNKTDVERWFKRII